ncbi:hypothetical protein CBR_g22982 [Chara braunii]|uniref:serine O-acetyltransferase n=1 Tax=Chara braunii TaxID=69332 RepID=A0A388L393_CHABU|nr:hypothetical protein CBR_g22982 [Chara braunii]|eukprot:GBG76766.1 hypothetical protein CBR_g22982 [Chara braunii]
MKMTFNFPLSGSKGMPSAAIRRTFLDAGCQNGGGSTSIRRSFLDTCRQNGGSHGSGKGGAVISGKAYSTRKGPPSVLFTKRRWELEQSGARPAIGSDGCHGRRGQYISKEASSILMLSGGSHSCRRTLTVARKFCSLPSAAERALENGGDRYCFTNSSSLACPSVWDVRLSKSIGVGCVAKSGYRTKKSLKTAEQNDSYRLLSSLDRNSSGSGAEGPAGSVLVKQEGVKDGAKTPKEDLPAKESADERTSSSGADLTGEQLWQAIREEARRDSESEPALASFLYSTILAHPSLERALAFHIANKLCSSTLLSTQLYTLIADTFMEDADIRAAVRADLQAVKSRDPACVGYSHCLLNFKGFLACQSHRVAHRLWNQGRIALAFALHSRVSEVFHVDFHPAAKVGHGVLFDHATGVVVGETAEIGNNVSILHHVTLGGTGSSGGIRHPRVGDGVLIGAGATVLGPVRIGQGAKIGAGSVVLSDVPAHCTAVGNPAKLLGGNRPIQLNEIPSENMDHTSFIDLWSDYII